MDSPNLLSMWKLVKSTVYHDEYPDLSDEDLELYSRLSVLAIWEDSGLEDRLDIIRWESEDLKDLSEFAKQIFDAATYKKWRNIVNFEKKCEARDGYGYDYE